MAILLAGCSSSSTPVEEKPADYVALLDVGYPFAMGQDNLPDGAGLLIGPHYTVRLDSIVITEQVRAAIAKRGQLGGADVRAAAGYELVLAQWSGDGLQPRWGKRFGDPDTEGVSAVVVVGDREVKLDKLPQMYDVLAVSVPKGEKVWLRITDAERTQSLSLRDGSRGDDAVEGFYRPKYLREIDVDYEKVGTLTVPGGYRRTLKVSLSANRVHLEPWVPSAGWAPEGKAWLQVSGITVRSDALYWDPGDSADFPADFRIDLSRTFTLTLPDGVKVAAQKRKPIPATQADLTEYSVVFAVPAVFAKGSIRIAPTGTIKALFKNLEPVIGWTKAPAPQDVKVDLTP